MRVPIQYPGGKSFMARKIVACLPEHRIYVEPFAGGASVFFAKPKSSVEILNDLDGRIINFFNVLRYHEPELVRILSLMPRSRELFSQTAEITFQGGLGQTDVQRAADFWYLANNGWGGGKHLQDKASSFRTPGGSVKRVHSQKSFDSMRYSFEEVSRRLQDVTLENRPYQKVLDQYDGDDTAFYLDPPYYLVGVGLYRHIFHEQDFLELAERLARLKGKFLLSGNDHPFIRQVFRQFGFYRVQHAYGLQGAKRGLQPVYELLIANYPLVIDGVDGVSVLELRYPRLRRFPRVRRYPRCSGS